MTEAEYWRDCQNLSTEIDGAIAIYETSEEVNNLAGSDTAVLECLNRSPLFWRIHKYSLQSALFMSMGRIFDSAPDAHSAHRVVGSTIAHPEMFSKEALAARKRNGGPEPEWLPEYLAEVWVPTAADLRPLKEARNSRPAI